MIPILVLLYNRADLAEQLLAILRNTSRATDLYIAIDGPKNNELDKAKVAKVVNLVNALTWEGKISTLIRTENAGCRIAVSSAIDWFFEHVQMGIILEDDCHPSSDFFDFVESMLIKYKDDTRIAQICGSNTIGRYEADSDYIFSNFGSIWGWGTWKRAWKLYDVNIDDFTNTPEQRSNLSKLICFRNDAYYRLKNFADVRAGKIDTWDYQWIYTRLSQHMLSVIPRKTLVTNVGFGEFATHTKSTKKDFLNQLDDEEIDWPNARSPTNYLPDYTFELKVLEFKRGFRGLGPIWLMTKIFQLIIRRLATFFSR